MRIIVIVLFFFIVIFPQISNSFDTTKIIFHFRGEEVDSYIGENLTNLGDINNDGYPDISITSSSPDGVYIFYGGNPVDTIPDLFLKGHSGITKPVDIDGDGIRDIISYEDNYPNALGTGVIYFYKGYTDSIASIPFDSLKPDTNNYDFTGRGAFEGVKTEYVDSDSNGDLLTFKWSSPGGKTLYYYSGINSIDNIPDWQFQIPNNKYDLRGFGFIDFDGDNHLDIYAGMHEGTDTTGYVYIFKGPSFGATPDIIIAPPLGHDSISSFDFVEEVDNIGDIDGDGWDDLGVRNYFYNFIYLCGSPADTIYDYILQGKLQETSRAGDINGDSYNDVLCGFSRTMDGVVDVYLGGTEFDIYYDESIYRAHLPPLLIDDIGYELSPAGDFNGDGYDDFMFSTRNFVQTEEYGEVFIIAGGPYLVTDVDESIIEPIPESFKLKQNYPNPFNPTTTIEFSLTTRQQVKLEVYNILGERVATLLNKQLPVGHHIIEWDGMDDSGNQISSGIYFYRLTTGETVQSKKMVLIK